MHISNRVIFPQNLTVLWSAGIPVWKQYSILLSTAQITSSRAVGYYLSMVLIRLMRLHSAFEKGGFSTSKRDKTGPVMRE